MKEEKYKILKYLRLSLEDDDGEDESNSIANQRHLVNTYIQERFIGKNYTTDEIVDDGYSGTNFKRPGITRALELLKSGKFNCIIVKDLSRFGRDHIKVGNYLEHIFPAMEVRVISINDQYDSDERIGAPGGIDIALKNLIYELYSKDLSQKVKAARRTIMKTGKYNAPFSFYGYIKHNDTVVLDEVAGAVMARLFNMLDTGSSTSDVAKTYNAEGIPTPAEYKRSQNCKRKWIREEHKTCWTVEMIRRLASDERYTGKMILGKTTRTKVGDPCSAKKLPREEWVIIENAFPATVSQEQFDRVNEKIHCRPKHQGNRVNHQHSIYHCGNCGHTLSKSGKVNVSLKCRYSVLNPNDECLCEAINRKELHDILKMILHKQFTVMQCEAKKYKTAVTANNGVTYESIEGELLVLKKQRFASYERFKNGEISREELDLVRNRIASRVEELEELSKNIDKEIEVSEIKTCKADTILNYGQEDEYDENFVNYFIKRVNIFNGKRIEIQWNFGLDEFLQKTS